VAYRSFLRAVDWLTSRGFEPINPAEQLLEGPERSWEEWMRISIGKLIDCDGILMLPNWRLSRGARLEYKIARALKMPIIFLSEDGGDG